MRINMFRILQDYVKGYQKEQLGSGEPEEVDTSELLEGMGEEEQKDIPAAELLPAFVVTKNERLWTKIGETVDVPLEKIEETAMRVVTELMFGSLSEASNHANDDLVVRQQQFRQFHHTYVLNQQGSHEFFSRVLVAVCSEISLAQQDIDDLVDVLYAEHKVLQNKTVFSCSYFNSPPELFPLPENKNALKNRLNRKRILEGKVTFGNVLEVLRDMAPPSIANHNTRQPAPALALDKLSLSKKPSSSSSTNYQMMKKALSQAKKSPNQLESEKLFKTFDKNGDNRWCLKEVGDFVKSQPPLWAMMGVNLNLDEGHCQRIATRVTLELALASSSTSSTTSTTAPPNDNLLVHKKQFHSFRKKYLQDPIGNQEFFHRCVFAAFDADGDSLLNYQELDGLLEVFYMEGSIFAGDARLPSTKEELRQQVVTSEEENPMLSFEDVRGLISGTHTM